MTTALAPSLFKMHDGVNGINTSMQSNTSSSSSSSSSQEENAMLQRHQNDHTPAADAIDCNQNDNDERMQEGGKQTNPKSLHNNKGEPNIFYASTHLSKFKIEALLRLFFYPFHLSELYIKKKTTTQLLISFYI